MNNNLSSIIVLAFVLTIGCTKVSQKKENLLGSKIFKQLHSKKSGIAFTNTLQEDSTINYFTYPYLYMGGGVSVGDLNNDGWQDIYFTGNRVENKLYLNKSNLTFEDVSQISKTSGDDRWMTGSTMVDINADGWLDIYVCVSGKFTTSKNLMYVNQGVNKEGIPIFKEMAEELGIADSGKSIQGVFFDYDKDGDLDLYVANYPFTSFKTPNVKYSMLMFVKDIDKSDKLYRNKGNGFFEDVTEKAGILNFGLTVSATVGDFNQDGWQDIYVSNDFATPDYFYFNNKDGTFSERLRQTTQHTSFFGMGVDVADFNNDGLLDILQLDMTPDDNFRSKANMSRMNPFVFWEMVGLGFHYQYMQNVFQVNNGITKDGYPHFSDVARLSGVSFTDWSWAALMVDLDNDGWKDIYITNGTRKDINNKDYFEKIDNATYEERMKFDRLKLSKEIPHQKISNYAFQNNRHLTFVDVSEKWGLNLKGYSNGAAYADLDNDGDLDIVTNNIDDLATIHQNLTSDKNLGNYLRIKLIGDSKNPLGIGSKIKLETENNQQFFEFTMTRGFQSSVEPYIHFGLGDENIVEKLTIIWNDGKEQTLKQISANQFIEVDYHKSIKNKSNSYSSIFKKYMFSDRTNELGIDFLHFENPYNDFNHEILLPHMYSKNGPGLAVGDVNGDNREDFFIGGAIGYSGVIYQQNLDGTFQRSNFYHANEDILKEDMGAVFFDADGDKDLDLYVVSGGNEYPIESKNFQDRLYINNGKGFFSKSPDALPKIIGSGSRVKVGDYDNDGDLDLFVGGRVIPKTYPFPAKSYILKNESKKSSEHNVKLLFKDVTAEVAPELEKAGLVTDAEWVDYDLDGFLDLIIVGEWMPITFLKNMGNRFKNKTDEYGMEKSRGWWYSIKTADFDNDGDQDIVVGNLGLNYKYQASKDKSFDVYANDFDNNGILDIVLSYYNNETKYPLRGRECSSQQMPSIKQKFPNYNSFASSTLQEVYGKRNLKNSLHYQAWNFASSYIENKGNEHFHMRNLPNEVQISSINGIIIEDFNNDGNLDMIVAGNIYGSEVETTRNDAGYGKLLLGDGHNNFKSIPFEKSGISLKYDTKDMAKIMSNQGTTILVANNQDSLRALVLHKYHDNEIAQIR